MECSIPSWVPKKLRERVDYIDKEEGLTDGCEYMMYLAKPWECYGGYSVWLCENKKEVLDVLRNAEKIDVKEWEERH